MREWLETELGVAPWAVEAFLPPLIGLALVFLARELVLFSVRRRHADPDRRRTWRRRTLWIALPLGLLAAVCASWLRHQQLAEELAAGAAEAARVQIELGSMAKLFAYTVFVVTLLLGLRRLSDNLLVHIDSWKLTAEGIKVQHAVLLPPDHVRKLATGGLRIARTVLLVVALYVYIPLVLSAIPQTREFADKAMPYLMAPVIAIVEAVIGYLPDLVTLVVIVLVGRFLIRLFRVSMEAIGSGGISLEGFEPEWADPTYKLGRLLIVVVLIMMSYPYIPGSGSAVFKGFSLFFGALVTLGASASIANIIAGIILTYTGSFRVGDRVRVGETVGAVTEKKLFVTRIRTPFNDEVTVPNGLVMQSQIVNYTVASEEGGLALTVEAGIGYDVDWRKVHELLIGAAGKTDGIVAEPAPFVLQHGLGDFAVQYKLVAFTEDAGTALRTVSELRRHALDQFHTAGIEIMTPVVQAVRNAPVLATPDGATAPDPLAPFRTAPIGA